MAMPLKWKDPQAMEDAINDYFTKCEGKLLADKDGNPILDKFGHPIVLGAKPPTASGLAFHLGFKTRRSLLDYKGRAGFADVMARAKLRLQIYAEERLYDRDGQRGAEFSLKYNFDGNEVDKDKAGDGAAVVRIVCDIPKPTVAAPTPEESDGSSD